MNREKWNDIKTMILDKYEILENENNPIEYKTGENSFQHIGSKEILMFNSPMGKIKLEYIVKPVVLDRKEHYSKRMGTSSKTEYVLSSDEFVERMEAFIEKDNVWEKIDSGNFQA